MAVEKYIDYIDDPNDTYEEYLEKAKKYNFRCVFFDGEDLDSYQKGLEILKGTDIVLAGAIDFPEGVMSLEEKMKDFEKMAAMGVPEIDYVLNRYDLKPAAFVAYDRAAYYGKGNEELRITFDRNICCRCSGLDLKNGVYGTMLLNKDQILMEVKIPGAMPLWMSRLFSDMELFPVSYSKYGAYYKEYLYQVIFIEGGRICA